MASERQRPAHSLRPLAALASASASPTGRERGVKMKLCKDCRHFEGFKTRWLERIALAVIRPDANIIKCLHPRAEYVKTPAVVDLCLGWHKPEVKDHHNCAPMRGYSSMCGSEGKLWEPRT